MSTQEEKAKHAAYNAGWRAKRKREAAEAVTSPPPLPPLRFPVPRRTDAPWCRTCGMNEGWHWPGAPCNEPGFSGEGVERAYESAVDSGTESDPGAASTARGQATADSTGDDE